MKKLLTTGTILIIVGLIIVLTQMESHTFRILGIVIEFLGVGIVVLHRVKNNQLNKLKPALISLGLICTLLLVYIMLF